MYAGDVSDCRRWRLETLFTSCIGIYRGLRYYDLVIKNLVLNRGNKQVKKLHKDDQSILCRLAAQSKMMRVLQELN